MQNYQHYIHVKGLMDIRDLVTWMVATAFPSVLGDVELFFAVHAVSVSESQSPGTGSHRGWSGVLVVCAILAILVAFSVAAIDVDYGRAPGCRTLASFT